MRLRMVLVVACAGLRAQTSSTATAEEAARKLAQKVEQLKNAPPNVCSIPLLQVKPAGPVDPKMTIVPKGEVRYQIREVIPPAPVCESVRWK